MTDILTYVETLDGAASDGALECLSRGRQLASGSGAKLGCVVAGSGIAGLGADLIARGADVVHVADSPALKEYLTATYRKVVADLVASRGYGIVLVPSSTQGNDLGPALAARIDAACVLDCQQVSIEGGALVMARSEFERKVLTSWRAAPGKTVVATLRDGAAEAAAPDPARRGEVAPVAVDVASGSGKSRMVRRDVARKTVNLREARVVVTAGAGLGARENMKLVEDLAAALGGEVAATRAAVDAGWVSAERQVGQTGVTVRPRLYLACGVSGAVQHRVGMMDSSTIVAINTDAAAPIFRIAHYRLLGDVKVVIPKLLKLLAQRKKET